MSTQTYRGIILPDVGGESQAFGINSAGYAVGWAGFGFEAVEWSPKGTATVLPDVGGHGFSEAFAINNAGDVVGVSLTDSGREAVEWSPNGMATVLPDVGGRGESEARAINSAGYAVGYSATGPSHGHEAVEWSPNGTATVLPDVEGQGFYEAFGINNAGYVVGYSDTSRFIPGLGGGRDAVEWSPKGTATVLPDVGGLGFSVAQAINSAGYAVGYSETDSGREAVEWSPKGTATVLPFSDAFAINSAGDVVGTGSGGEAVEWSPNGTTTVLPDVGGQGFSDAFGVNNAGDIVGASYTDSGYKAVEWSPIGKGGSHSSLAPHVSVQDHLAASAITLLGLPGFAFAGLDHGFHWPGL